jgi:hypothetical protein
MSADIEYAGGAERDITAPLSAEGRQVSAATALSPCPPLALILDIARKARVAACYTGLDNRSSATAVNGEALVLA